jgi:hypothetical protein
MAADEERKEPEQVEHEGDHERRLWPDGAGESITCRADDLLARDRIRYVYPGAILVMGNARNVR